MRRRLLPVLVLAASTLAFTACTTPSSTPSSSPSSAPSSTASAEPEVDPQLTVTLDGLTFTDDDGTTEATFEDSDALLSLLEKATGELPAPEAVEDMPGYELNLETYTWDGLQVTADSTGESPSWVTVTGAEVDGIPIATEEGLTVGSTRADLLAAEAWALVDTEDPATATELGLGGREVPDTQSLTHPGSVGIIYVLFVLDGDEVTRIMSPSNDFSDL
ncbi:hypothetical protein [Microbacterium sp. PMB16]|uniref:hypothetical protein n=1 Tax=Microbacterium sp. PMB16 TaxID=3120157 RepID=UPI003F4B0116